MKNKLGAKPKFTKRKGGMAATVLVPMTIWEEDWPGLVELARESEMPWREVLQDICLAGLNRSINESLSDDLT